MSFGGIYIKKIERGHSFDRSARYVFIPLLMFAISLKLPFWDRKGKRGSLSWLQLLLFSILVICDVEVKN